MRHSLVTKWIPPLALMAACASAPSVSIPLVAPRRVADEPALPSLSPTIATAEQTLMPGVYTPIDTMRRLPGSGSKAAESAASPYDVITKANQAAESTPSPDGYFNAIQTYMYTPGMLYQVYCATGYATDVALQPGEKHVDGLVIGDMLRWVTDFSYSAENGVTQEHVIIKPMQPGLSTNLVINTNRRSYFLELHSYKDDTYMVAVRWRYPQDEVAKKVAKAHEQAEQQREAIPLNPAAINFHYALEILQGDPPWLPTMVFDDGRKTYIRFPTQMQAGEVPAVFVERNGELQLVNSHPRGEYYVVDRLFEVAELRVGQQHQDIVRIERIRR